MPITRLLTDTSFTPEQQKVVELAFEKTIRQLDLVDRNDPICEIVARKVIEIVEGGTMSEVAITEMALKELDPRVSVSDR